MPIGIVTDRDIVLALVARPDRVAHLAIVHMGLSDRVTLTPRRRDASAIDRNLVVLHLPFHR